jgi:hypothetical protein
MSDIEIPRWPKRTILWDPDEEDRARAMRDALRTGTLDEAEFYLGTPPGFATLITNPPRVPRRFDSHGLENEDDGSGPFDELKRYAAQRTSSDQAAAPAADPSLADTPSPPPHPSVGRRLLNSYVDTELAVTQGLSERDLRDAEPLPEALAAYNLPPGQGTQANINELGPLVRAEARTLGLEIVVRRSAENGELGFALRPKASSRLLDGDGPLASAVNKGAQVADGLGRMLGFNAAGPVGGAARASAQTAKAASAAATEAKIVLTGRELGEFGDDLKAWIKAGSDKYKRLRDQGPVHNAAIGDVRLTGAGLKEMRHTGTDPRKWQLVPALPEIIQKAELIHTAPLQKPRPDGIVEFQWLETDVALGHEKLRVGVQVGVDGRGNKFYNLNHDLDAWAQKYQPPGVGPVIESGVPGAAGGRTSTPDVGPLDDGINLYILGPATGSAAHAAAHRHDEER